MLGRPYTTGNALQYATYEHRADRKIVIDAMFMKDSSVYSHPLQFASKELKADKNIVYEAVKFYGKALQFASIDLQADKEIVLLAVTLSGNALRYASQDMSSDREVVLTAVRENGHALAYASSSLKADKCIVIEAVKQNGMALEHADSELCNDREVAIEAVTQNGHALRCVSKTSLMDILKAIAQNREVVRYVCKEFQIAQENWERRRFFLLLVNASLIISSFPEDPFLLRQRNSIARRKALLRFIEENGELNLTCIVEDYRGARVILNSLISSIFGNIGLVKLITEYL